MADHGASVLIAILLWWASTGAILVLGALPRGTFGWSMLGATGVLIAAAWGLMRSAAETSPTGAVVAFVSALGVWAWIEMSFLMGFVTGPRTTPCPADADGWQRFRMALETLLYHELAILLAGVLIVAATWGAPNPTGMLTFLLLATMRISAKLNIFFGVPNLTVEFMPPHLAYLTTYFRKRAFNAFFPVSVVAAAGIATLCLDRARAAPDGSGAAVGFTLLLTLAVLALLEHLFMVLPLRDAALWRWLMPQEKAGTARK
jgi:putative photosynthetic complex assembly protein 2